LYWNRNDVTNSCPNRSNEVAHSWKNALKISTRNFSFLFLFGFSLRNLRYLFRGVAKKQQPFELFRKLKDAAKFPLFIALLPVTYQMVRCTFSWLHSINSDAYESNAFEECLAGLISGFSAMTVAHTDNNASIALYTFWKMIEVVYFHLASQGFVPLFVWADSLLYSLAAAYLLGLAILEPQALRPAYFRFIQGLTGNRVLHFNRALLSEFGFDSLRIFPKYGYSDEAIPAMVSLKKNRRYLTRNPTLYLPQQIYHF